MRKIYLTLVTSTLIFSVFSVFSKPNPNSGTAFNNYKSQQEIVEAVPTPATVEARLAALPCEIEMKYNAEVQSNIERYFKNGNRQLTDLLTRASYYLPIFEKALKEAGLPDELKYLPVIESNLKPNVTSNRGAGGLWQFMPGTAKGYDMKITSTIDERCDPYLSSERACTMLKKQYERFGDWTLALAAYNAGSGTVSRALKRAGGDPRQHTFWTIYNYLPAQTRHYVPKFIAINYVMNFYKEHNVKNPVSEPVVAADTVRVSKKVNFSQISGVLGVSMADLRNLNPHLRADMAPATADRPCTLVLPAHHVDRFKEMQDQILVYNQGASANTEVTTAAIANAKAKSAGSSKKSKKRK